VDNLLDGVAGPLPQKPPHYLARIRDNADRLSRMVSDLLDLTRIEAGKVEFCAEALAVGDVVGDAAESLRQVAALTASCSPSIWPRVPRRGAISCSRLPRRRVGCPWSGRLGLGCTNSVRRVWYPAVAYARHHRWAPGRSGKACAVPSAKRQHGLNGVQSLPCKQW
jgi:hypothetical protein